MAALRLEGVQPRGLEPVHLTIDAGEVVLLSGPSGSGKSLLLRAIADLDPQPGEVWLDETRRSALPAPTWRRRVGLLPADTHWWADQVGEHFAAPADDRLTDLLARLGFDRDALGWSVNRLSSGERQRLGLARLLSNRPDALLLDEPTANLDPAGGSRIEALLEAYRRDRGAAVLWVSHDPEQRRRLGGRRLVIDSGQLAAEP